MKSLYICIFLLFSMYSISFAQGTYTVSMLKALDTEKNYLNPTKLTLSKVIETNAGMEVQKEKLCITVSDPIGAKEYKITNETEIIILLIDIMNELNAQLTLLKSK